MCISPIKIKNKSKYINRHSLHKLTFDVPCGQCCECLAAKLNEYYFRSYYQAIETWNKNGYCLFDTLTYNNDNVPHVNDFVKDLHIDYLFPDELNFTCFNYEDIRLFFVRLRRALEYRGFDVSNNLKYFLCSEYGEDPRYTHRPHYHVMFYVTDPSLSPVELSNLIDKNWQKGITDGVNYKGSDYVLKKRVFQKGDDDLHMLNVCHYIGKYMTKDSSFTLIVKARLLLLLSKLREYYAKKVSSGYIFNENDINAFKNEIYSFDGFFVTDTDKKLLVRIINNYSKSENKPTSMEANIREYMKAFLLTKSVKRDIKLLRSHISQFTRLSKGFGLYMIDALGADWIFQHNCVRMPDLLNIWKEIPIPQYIINKLFKEKKVDSYGNKYYGWSEYGNLFRMYHAEKSLEKMKTNILDTFNSINLKSWHFKDSLIKEWLSVLMDCLKDYSIDDIVYYDKYIRGRLNASMNASYEPDYESFYYIDLHDYFNLKSSIPSEIFFQASIKPNGGSGYVDGFVTTLGSGPGNSLLNCWFAFEHPKYYVRLPKHIDKDAYEYLYENYVYRDLKIDSLLCLYQKIKRLIGEKKQLLWNEKRDRESRLKALGYNIKN